MKTIAKIILLGTLISLTSWSCTKELYNKYITPQYSAYSFSAASDSCEIDIQTNTNWSISNSNTDWLTAEKIDNNILKLKVNRNTTTNYRETVLILSDGNLVKTEITILQNSASFHGEFHDITQMDPYHTITSPGLKKIASIILDMESYKKVPIILDIATNKTTILNNISGIFRVSAISDDGKTIACELNGKTSTLYIDGKQQDIKGLNGDPKIQICGMSSDGKIIVGNSISQDNYSTPVYLENNELKELPMPDDDPFQSGLPSGIIVKGCSPDGRIIYGIEPTSFGLIYWKNGELFYPGYDNATIKTVLVSIFGTLKQVEKACTICLTDEYAELKFSSANGRYIAAKLIDYIQEKPNEPAIKYSYPARIDTETGEINIIKTEMTDAAALTVNNEGLLFCTEEVNPQKTGYVFNPDNSSYQFLQDWFSSQYGLQISKQRIVTHVSDDNMTFFGSGESFWYTRLN